jgi:CubicO group peptidase (beta-lactamase class C family)
MVFTAYFVVLMFSWGACAQPPPGVLREEFQKLLDGAVMTLNEGFREQGNDTMVAIQLGWRTASEHFGVASGMVKRTNKSEMRAATPKDTVLFGSGTKTVVASAVMRLIDSGKMRAEDLASKYLDPFLLKNNGTTLENMFGPSVLNATVLDLLRMSAGIPGFEVGGNTIDSDALESTGKVWTVYDWVQSTTTYCNQTNPSGCMTCMPGTCTRYSSTSYQLAGLLVAAVQNPQGDWDDLDLRAAAFPDPSRYPSLQFPADKPAHLAAYLTSPGTSINPQWGEYIIQEQNPSILGWTCGNMVGTVTDEAAFLYDLLDADSPGHGVVSESSLTEMKRLEYLTQGWGAGSIKYGAGLMTQNVSYNVSTQVRGPEDWGWAIGHGGETYGFSSCNGYIPKLRAAYSIALNVDIDQGCDIAQCHVMDVVARFLGGENPYLNCSKFPSRPRPGPPHGPGGGPGPHGPPHGPPHGQPPEELDFHRLSASHFTAFV